jgi:tetratricopeptide (TPR) repeat protein
LFSTSPTLTDFSVSNFTFRHIPQRPLALFAAVCVTLISFPGVSAADDESGPQYTNDATGETLSTLPALFDAKNYDGALQALMKLIPSEDPASYDMSVVDDTIAKTYYQGKDDPAKAIEYWEKMWALVKLHPEFLTGKDHYEFMAQAYFGEAAAMKTGTASQLLPLYDNAIQYTKLWLASTPKITPEERLFVTELYYYKALNGGSQNIDMDALMETKRQANEALITEIKPKDIYYQLLFQIAEQQNDFIGAAKYLEYLVKITPTGPQAKDYWQQLFVVYNNLAVGSDKDARQQRVYYARAIVTMERAQALGFSNTDKDNFNLVTLYNECGQYTKAAQLMHDGLKSGKIEDSRKNWEILSYFYRMTSHDLQAVDILKEAEAIPKYSELGDLDLEIAKIYVSMDDTQNTYDYAKKAVEKGHFDSKPYEAYQFLAYSAFELGKLEEALQVCDEALKIPDAPKEINTLKDGIEKSIKVRDQEKAMINAETK